MILLNSIKNILRNTRQFLFCRNNDNENLTNYKYFIFIDSKVPNILEQIYPYFLQGFFNKKDIVIVYRYHFENIRAIKRAIKKFNLKSYCFINLRDIPTINNAIWFYTHNSMTNLAVINKNVYSKHLWIGHGDSEKVSSYKKIIRIYDYCLVAGDESIKRFYKHNIFRLEENYRFIKIGKAALCSIIPSNVEKNLKKKSLLFAPTWEGPMNNENYSTLHLYNETVEVISNYINNLSLNDIVIKFHPNTGLRDSKYIKYMYKIINNILLQNLSVVIIAEKDSWIYKILIKKFRNKVIYYNTLFELENNFFVKAITNISAMATMCYAEEINTTVICDKSINIQKNIKLGFTEKIYLDQYNLNNKNYLNLKNYKNKNYISYMSNWDKLKQNEIFKQVVKTIRKG